MINPIRIEGRVGSVRLAAYNATVSNEFDRIELIQRLLPSSQEVTLGIGDDAAILKSDARAQVYTVDCEIEHVHFRRDFAALEVIGFRALMAALSDLAAMGAEARALLLSLVLPKPFSDQELTELMKGVAQAAKQADVAVIGGNLSAGAELALHTTCIGAVAERALTRSGAKAGDAIYVTGPLGAAALGLACLMRHHRAENALPFIEAWQTPKAKLDEGRKLTQQATACIDISDGLLQDLGHLCRASNVGATLYYERIPVLSEHSIVASELDLDAQELTLTGGEDYELLFTYPAKLEPTIAATQIGHIEKTLDIKVLDSLGDAMAYTSKKLGYSHF